MYNKQRKWQLQVVLDPKEKGKSYQYYLAMFMFTN